MATIIVNTQEGNELHFQDADTVAKSFLKIHDIFMPKELENFGFADCLETVTLFELDKNKFEAKYLFDRIVVDVESFLVDGERDYYLSTAIKVNLCRDSWAEIHAYEEGLFLPEKTVKTANQVRTYLNNVVAQVPN